MGYLRQGKRDGTGPAKGSFMRRKKSGRRSQCYKKRR